MLEILNALAPHAQSISYTTLLTCLIIAKPCGVLQYF